jgi:hypothetical protein
MKLYCCLLNIFLTSTCIAQIEFGILNKKLAIPAFTKSAIVVDGYLSDSSWQQVTSLGDFVQYEPKQGMPSAHKTKVKIAYDLIFLYIGAFMEVASGKTALRVINVKRDFDLSNQDYFRIHIDGFNDKRNAMVFAINPYGAQHDYIALDGISTDVDWDGLWYAKTKITDSGWYAEFAIPWKTLRYKHEENNGTSWAINFSRNNRFDNETSVWSEVPRSLSIDRMDFAGELQKFTPSKQSSNIRIQPFNSNVVTIKNNRATTNTPQITPNFGGDIKWAPSPNIVVDATINTDFAQADVDRPIVNLSRFSIFLPERRQFFLENSSLFGAGITPLNGYIGGPIEIRPFYSRTIGLDPQGQPVPINVGLRLVSRSTKRTMGILYAKQSETNAKTDFFVGRLTKNIAKSSRIGFITTMKHKVMGETSKTDISGSVDGLARLNNSLALNYTGSFTKNWDDSTLGFAGVAQFNYLSNNYTGWLSSSFINAQYNPSMGFVYRNNVVSFNSGFYKIIRSAWVPKFIRSFEPGISADAFINYQTGITEQVTISYEPISAFLNNGGGIFLFVEQNYQQITAPFKPVGVEVAIGKYHYASLRIAYRSDASKRFYYMGRMIVGKYYNANYIQYFGWVTYAPTPFFYISPQLQIEYFRGLGVTRVNASSSLLTVEGRIALNARTQLSAFYQKNAVANASGLNIRFAWEFRPLSFLYFVYNSRNFIENSLKQNSQQGVTKISFVKQL